MTSKLSMPKVKTGSTEEIQPLVRNNSWNCLPFFVFISTLFPIPKVFFELPLNFTFKNFFLSFSSIFS